MYDGKGLANKGGQVALFLLRAALGSVVKIVVVSKAADCEVRRAAWASISGWVAGTGEEERRVRVVER